MKLSGSRRLAIVASVCWVVLILSVLLSGCIQQQPTTPWILWVQWWEKKYLCTPAYGPFNEPDNSFPTYAQCQAAAESTHQAYIQFDYAKDKVTGRTVGHVCFPSGFNPRTAQR